VMACRVPCLGGDLSNGLQQGEDRDSGHSLPHAPGQGQEELRYGPRWVAEACAGRGLFKDRLAFGGDPTDLQSSWGPQVPAAHVGKRVITSDDVSTRR